ncbi:MAG: dihydropteroate synthase [Bacteroidales bacterium]
MAKDTFFCPKKSLNCRGKLVQLSTPRIMGILNLTPDSFYDGGKYLSADQALKQGEKLLADGADILDLGAASTRPGAPLLPQTEERERLEPILKAIVKAFPEAIISLDTYYAQTAEMAVNEGAHMINDVSAGRIDPGMFETIARLRVPYILMHMQGTPQTMQQQPAYTNLLKDIAAFFYTKIAMLEEMGVHDIIIDPGFGFGKTLEHNYRLLHGLDFLAMFERPILAGLSRKSIVNKVLGIPAREALNGTSIVNALALLKGADILRVHDVKEAVEAVKIIEAYKTANQQDSFSPKQQ